MHRRSVTIAIAIILALIFSSFGNISSAKAISLSDITVKPITWNVIGLDSNNPSVGPDTYPVGVRVCNNSTTALEGVTADFVWDTTNSYINLRAGSYGTSGNPYPSVTIGAGECSDFYFEVVVSRNAAAYDTTARYHINITAGTLGTISTTRPRELYVEHLISQSRNSTTDIQLNGTSIPAGGTMALVVGQTYSIKLVGNTATNGYEQIENYINFPNTIFQINGITTTYTATDTISPDPDALEKLYADGCAWVNNPDSPYYRTCTDTGKYGGNITVTYNVKIIGGAGTTQNLNNLIYDFSGSSYHYNADYSIAGRLIAIIDPSTATISKAFSPTSTISGGVSTLTFTLRNPNGAALNGASFTDSLPAGMTVASPATYSTSGCGTPLFAPTVGDSSLSFSNGTIPANGTCTVQVRVKATAAEGTTLTNTSENLFIGSVDTGNHASASLTISSTPAVPACTDGVVLASWTMDTSHGTTVPPVPSYKSNKVTTATASYAGTGAQSINTTVTGDLTNVPYYWQGTGWAKTTSGYAGSSAPYLQIAVDSSKFSAVKIAFSYYLDGNWANAADNKLYVYSSTDNTSYGNILTSSTAITRGQWYSQSTLYAANPGINQSTYFRINAIGAQKPESGLVLDNIVVTGCGVPDPVTIDKSFSPNPVGIGSSSSLTFTISNPEAVAQSGIAFTDVLPSGLTVNDGSYSTCGGTLTTTAATNTISFTGGSLAAGASCATTGVAVTATTAGPHQNVSGTISSTQAGTNSTASGMATASLTAVKAPKISKLFDPNPIVVGQISTLTFLLENPNTDYALTSVSFTDTYPANMLNLSPSSVYSTTCPAGTITAAAGGNSVSFTGGTIPAGGSCTVSVDVKSSAVGSWTNTSGAISDTLAGTGNTASATLTVNPVHPALSLLKQISTSSTGPWSSFKALTTETQVYYRFTIENTGDVALSSVYVSDPTLVAAGADMSPCTGLDLGLDETTYLTTCVVGPVTVASGLHSNTAKAYGIYGGNTFNSAQSTATYATASLNIVKDVTEANFSAEGDVLHYTYSVANNGSAALEGPVIVVDDKSSDESCPAVSTVGDLDDFLDAGENLTCTATYTITADDMTAGSVTNNAYATASGVNSATVSKTVTVLKANPTITTTASGTTGIVGTEATFGDTATITGGDSPTGSVTFTLYSDSTCATAVPGMSGSGAISGDSASWSSTWTPAATGTYYWKASYPGDAKNNAYTTACGGLNEEITIDKTSPTITTNSVGKTGTIGTAGTYGDTATISGGYLPTGSVDFALFSDDTCTTAVTGVSGSGTITGTSASYSTTWTPTATGTYYWKASYAGDENNNTFMSPCGGLTEETTITKASPTISTVADPSLGTFGATGTYGDSATINGGYLPSGSVEFTLYSDAVCTIPVAGMSGSGMISGNSASFSGIWTPNATGTYYWRASYAGDTNNNGFLATCGAANESLTIARATPSVVTTVHDASHTPITTAAIGDVVHDSALVSSAVGTPTGTVTFEFFNNGTCTAPAAGTSTAIALASGEADGISFAQTLTANGDYSFRATYGGDANFESASGDCEPFSVSSLPDISVTKVASVASVPETGGSVTFTYTVSNDGTVPVTITDLGDDVFTTISGSPTCQVGTTLTAGGSCSFTYTTTLSGTAGDTHTNTFTVTAEDADGNADTDSDSADVAFTDVLPDINVTKTANVASVPETGGSVTFTYTVSNDGTIPVTITNLGDDIFTTITGSPTCQIGTTLAAGSDCSFTYTTTLNGTAGDTHTNTFTVSAEDVDGNSDTASDSADVNFTDVLPDINVTKTASVASVPETGGSVTFTYTVNNDGAIPVTITDLADDMFAAVVGDSTCQVGTTLTAGGSCSFTYTTTLSGTAGDTHTNIFTVSAEDVDGNSDTASDSADVAFTDVLPDISVTKTANVASVPETGGSVTFTYTVSNDGTIPVTITDLADDMFAAVVGDSTCQIGTTLAAGSDCSFTYTTTLSGTAGDTHTNTFTVTAVDVDGNSDTASDSADVAFTDVLPDISVTKTANVASVPETGGSVTFTYTVSNDGTIPVTITDLADDMFAAVVGDSTCQIGTTLAAGSDCSFTYTTTLSGTAGDTHTNTFTVTAEDADANSDTASDSADVAFTDVLPDISVTKTANVASVPETGGSVTFTYTVSNDGTIPVTITDLADDMFAAVVGDSTCQIGTTLTEGADCSFTYTTTLSGTAGDTHTNTFAVMAEDADGNADTDSDSADVAFTDVLPDISVTKTASVAGVPETGGSVTFTYTVSNDGTIPVTITNLGDDVFTTITGSPTCQVGTTLAAGSDCSFTYTTTLNGTAGDTHTNTFTVSAEDVDGNSDTASDSADVNFTDVLPDINVTKTASVASVPETGGSVTFTYTVSNDGTIPVTITDLADDMFAAVVGDSTCQIGTTLTEGADCSFTYTTTLSGTAGDTHTNTFTVTAEDADANSDTASDSADVAFTDILPDISVTKSASVAGVPETGGSVTFTYTVSNDGTIPVTITNLGDDVFTTITGSPTCQVGTTLAAGSDCSFTYTTTLSGTAGDTHTNTFTVMAEDADGNADTDSDSADVDFIDTGTSIIGVAKDLDSSVLVSSGTYDVTYALLVRNYGTKDLANLQLVDDLKATFPDPAIINVQSVSSADFTVNAGYDGDTDTDLLEGTDSLAAGDSGTILLVVRVTPDIAGPYNNSTTASAMTTTGSEIDDLSQDGTDPDGAGADHDGDPTNNSDPTPISFTGNLYDPPMGIKTVDGSGKPQLLWTMVWINNANHFAVNAVVHDPIPLNSTFVVTAGRTGTGMPVDAPMGSTMEGVSCTAGASTTTMTTMCYYEGPTTENPRGQVIWAGSVDSDFGITDPALAENAITISFAVTAANGVTRIRNSATIDSDLNANGTTSDPGEVDVATVSEVWGTSTHASTLAIPTTGDLKIPQTGFAPDVVTPLSVQPLDRQYKELGDFWLEIPSLGVKATIVGVPKAGNSWDVSWLGNQAGWLNGTAFPTWSGNSVITGHVYTSDGKPGPFINLGNLKYGDRIIVHAFGQQYVYEVRETALITTDDAEEMIRHEDLPWLTLVTCRGYDAVTNTYRFRYLVRAVQVSIK